MTMRLRDGWAANSRAPDHENAPSEAADAPAILINCRLVIGPFCALIKFRPFFLGIGLPFRSAATYAAPFYPTKVVRSMRRRGKILFLDKAARERLDESELLERLR